MHLSSLCRSLINQFSHALIMSCMVPFDARLGAGCHQGGFKAAGPALQAGLVSAVWISLLAETYLENRIKPPHPTSRKIEVWKAETMCLPSRAPENQWDFVHGADSGEGSHSCSDG